VGYEAELIPPVLLEDEEEEDEAVEVDE